MSQETVDWLDYKEENNCRHDDEGDNGVDEVTVQKVAAVDGEFKAGKVWLATDGGDKWSDQTFNQIIDDFAKSGADDDSYSQIDDIAAQDKLLKRTQLFFDI